MTEVIGVAVTSLQTVIAAYETVKTNKERLRSLVKRCEIVVDSLQRVVEERGEDNVWAADSLRIERLVQCVLP